MDVWWMQNLQLAINGVSVGAIYALVAVGLVLTYKATEVLNFAHGDVLMLAAFIGWALISGLGWSFWLAVPLTVSLVAVGTYLLERGVMRRIAGQPQFAGVMLTIGLAFMIRGAVSMGFGPESRKYETPFSGLTTRFGDLVIADLSLAIAGAVLLVTLARFVFLRKTAVGIAIQAASQDQLAAYLSGIRVKRLNSVVWGMSGGMAALAGLLLAPITLVDISLWFVLLKSLAALVLGGFGSASGAILGGLLIGLIESFAGVYAPGGIKDVAAYIVLIVVLVIYPRGLLGESHGKRV